MEPKRTWVYCRIAHDGPDSTDVLATQRHTLTAYAKENGLEIVGFSDDIGSGLIMDRPGLMTFHAAAENGAVDILLVHSLTRLGRDMEKVTKYWNLLGDLGVSVRPIKDCREVDLSFGYKILCEIAEQCANRPLGRT